jgi:hypothetical protein
MIKTICIPVIRNKSIELQFLKDQDNWVCTMSDEMMQDIALFFESGFYVLDRERPLIVQYCNIILF